MAKPRGVIAAMDKYAVFGNPISHSKSPVIHGLFAQQTGEAICYEAMALPVDDFAHHCRQFFQRGGKGANVTLPFKLDAFNLADELSLRGKLAGAVNTLTWQEGKILADNTDGKGLVLDLQRLLGSLAGASVLILGAGGATRGVIGPLFDAGVAQIHIGNRTASKATNLVELFQPHGTISGSSLQAIPPQPFNIVINASSASVSGDTPEIANGHYESADLAYDMFYKQGNTAFMEQALTHNPRVQVSDGLGMLVAQAAESFCIWRGIMPDISPVLTALRCG